MAWGAAGGHPPTIKAAESPGLSSIGDPGNVGPLARSDRPVRVVLVLGLLAVALALTSGLLSTGPAGAVTVPDDPHWLPVQTDGRNVTVGCTNGNPSTPVTLCDDYHGYPAIDILTDIRTPVHAVDDGYLVRNRPCDEIPNTNECVPNAAGNYVVVNHGSYWARYMHLSTFALPGPQWVKAGQLIGYSGNTGTVIPHLHFEITTGDGPGLQQPLMRMMGCDGGDIVVYPDVFGYSDWDDVPRDTRLINTEFDCIDVGDRPDEPVVPGFVLGWNHLSTANRNALGSTLGFVRYRNPPSPVTEAVGGLQRFDEGVLALRLGDAEAFAVHSGMFQCWNGQECDQHLRDDEALTGSWLGWPLSDEYAWAGGQRQDYEGGYIHWTPTDGAQVVLQCTEAFPGGPRSQTGSCDPPMSLQIDNASGSCGSIIRCTGPQGSTFVFDGDGYTGPTATQVIIEPNGQQLDLPPLLVENGSIHWEFTPVCSTPLGEYKVRVVDDETQVASNWVFETITAGNCAAPPTLRIDNTSVTCASSTSCTGPQESTFVFDGDGYTAGSTAAQLIYQPDGTAIPNLPPLPVQGDGSIHWEFTPGCTTPIGQYDIRVVDNTTGLSSNWVFEIITPASCGAPTLRIGNTSVNCESDTTCTGPQGSTFVFDGEGYTPGSTAAQIILMPDDTPIPGLPPLPIQNDGSIHWEFTPECTTPTGPYDIRVVDNTTGASSDWVFEIITPGACGGDPRCALSVSDVSVAEGHTGWSNPSLAVFAVSMPGCPNQVEVSYGTADGTASHVDDYWAEFGTLTFPPGVTTQSVSIRIGGDTAHETDENFYLELSNAIGGTVHDGRGTATIVNDDGYPTLWIHTAISNVVDEGNGPGHNSCSYQIQLDPQSYQTVTVDLITGGGTATAGADYPSVSETLVFPPGTEWASRFIEITPDTIPEPDEYLYVNLTSPVNAVIGVGETTCTILDDDTPPRIDVSKTADHLLLIEDDPITYFYAVTNPGPDALTSVRLSDDKCPTVVYQRGDDDGDGALGPWETWTYSCSTVLTETTTNVATASGVAHGQTATATAQMRVHVDPPPTIAITKKADRAEVAPGESVTYTYQVTNPGPHSLVDVGVVDDRCDPVDFREGDANGNGTLEVGETWRYACIAVLTETTTNVATATGTAAGHPDHRAVASDTATVVVTHTCNGLPVTLLGGDSGEVLVGTPLADVIHGRGGADTIDGGGGDDVICAGSGNDTIIGGPGDDLIFGEQGTDTVDYSGSPGAVTVNLHGRGRAAGAHGNDILNNIENIIGTRFDDTLRGSAKRNVIWGGAGNDMIQGLGGDDDLHGQIGDDRLNGRRGDDFLDGGPGVDQAMFTHAPTGLSVDLRVIGWQVTGDGTDWLSSIENVFGSRFGDTVFGNSSANEILGAKGDDVLLGRSGDDRLIGNKGFDTAYGGNGTDTCRTEVRFGCE